MLKLVTSRQDISKLSYLIYVKDYAKQNFLCLILIV